MAADDLPVFAHIIQPGQIVIIMGQHIPVRVAQADRNIGRNAAQQEINSDIESAVRVVKAQMPWRMASIKTHLPAAGYGTEQAVGGDDFGLGKVTNKLAIVIADLGCARD